MERTRNGADWDSPQTADAKSNKQRINIMASIFGRLMVDKELVGDGTMVCKVAFQFVFRRFYQYSCGRKK